MEIIRHAQGTHAGCAYWVKMWYDEPVDEWIIRYHWQTPRKRYTRHRRIAAPHAAMWWFGYSEHLCRQHIGIEPTPTSAAQSITTLAKCFQSSTPSEGRKSNPRTEYQRPRMNPQVRHFLKSMEKL